MLVFPTALSPTNAHRTLCCISESLGHLVIGNAGLRSGATKVFLELFSGSGGGGSEECFFAVTVGRNSLLSFPDSVWHTSSNETGKHEEDRFSSSEVSINTIESIITPCPFLLLLTLNVTEVSLALGELVLPIVLSMRIAKAKMIMTYDTSANHFYSIGKVKHALIMAWHCCGFLNA